MNTSSRNLIPLRCLLFCFFGGMGCLFPFLPLHMKAVGLTESEGHIISIVAPLVAAIGPLLTGPLADRLGGSGNRAMRMMLTVTMLLAAVCYALLMCVPTVRRLEARQPAVNFSCDSDGAAVMQERCMEPACYHWPEDNGGPLLLNGCHYECQTEPFTSPLDAKQSEGAETEETTDTITTESDQDQDQDQDEDEDQGTDQDHDEGDADDDIILNEPDETITPSTEENENIEKESARRKRHSTFDKIPPHLCVSDETGHVTCHVYTNFSKGISINASLLQATNMDVEHEKWCRYPLAGNFSCRIPPHLLAPLDHSSCQVWCNLPDPYTAIGSVLAQSQCQRMIGDASVTFWSYLLVRSVADVFPTTAVGLLDAAVVIATRETNLGRGDVGRELAWGSLGFAVFGPFIGWLTIIAAFPGSPAYFLSFTVFIVLMVISALILLFAHSMPLCRPEWWSRHTRVMPLGGLKRHFGEIMALIFVLILLGAFWSALDSYLPWHLFEFEESNLLIGLTLTAGALPAIPFLWNAERIVNYCGYSNLLIVAFIFYIIRYTVFSFLEDVWWALACEALEVFTLSLMWVTAILYMRHLMPRHLTATSQAMAVLFHFCLGRCLGAVIGAVISANTNVTSGSLLTVYRVGAAAAAVIASIYFIIYHCFLKPCCSVSTTHNKGNQPGVVQGPTTNGTYTPLRVYHNGSGQKVQFKH